MSKDKKPDVGMIIFWTIVIIYALYCFIGGLLGFVDSDSVDWKSQ